MKFTEGLKVENVVSVYRGRNGKCCCGCSGKHLYNPEHRALGQTRRGYDISDDEVSLSAVKRVVNILNKNTGVEIDANYLSIVIGKTLYIAYTV